MKKYLIILFLFPVSLLAQVNLSYIGQTFIDTTCTNVNGISIPRTDLATFVFKNNYVEACNTGGYMLRFYSCDKRTSLFYFLPLLELFQVPIYGLE